MNPTNKGNRDNRNKRKTRQRVDNNKIARYHTDITTKQHHATARNITEWEQQDKEKT